MTYNHVSIGLQIPADPLTSIGHLASLSFFDYFSIQYLKRKHTLCAVPVWIEWVVSLRKEEFRVPEHLVDACVRSDERFVYLPLSLDSKEGGLHANALFIDKKEKTVERFEPHGTRAYTVFKDYHYEELDKTLSLYFTERHALTYVSPVAFCPYLGPQSVEHYINQSGYCAAWSLWFADMRLTYPDMPRDQITRSMFDKLHEMMGKGTADEYLLNYAKQVYALMVEEFPHYRDFFINHDKYSKRKNLPLPIKRAFKKFLDQMDSLLTDSLMVEKMKVISHVRGSRKRNNRPKAKKKRRRRSISQRSRSKSSKRSKRKKRFRASSRQKR